MSKEEKQITIVIAASGEAKDVAVSPGATIEDIKTETGLKGYQISRKGGEPLPPNADVFTEVTDGEKLYATPEDVSVGGRGSAPLSKFINTLKRRIDSAVDKYKLYLERFRNRRIFLVKRVRLIRTRYISQLNTRRANSNIKNNTVKVVKNNKGCAYWQENGWHRVGNQYRGFYQTKYGKWRGVIIENYRNNHYFCIFMPPAILKKSSHWECFVYRGDGLYLVHFSQKPKDISSGILTIEQLITETFENSKKGDSDVS